jgi:hypothetical protein
MPVPSNSAFDPLAKFVVQLLFEYSLTATVSDELSPFTTGVVDTFDGDAGTVCTKLGAEGATLSFV